MAGGGGEAEPKRTRSNRDAAEHDNKPGPGSLVKAADDARPDALEALELQQAADASKAGAAASVGDAAPQRGPDTPVADEEVPVRRSAAHARARRLGYHHLVPTPPSVQAVSIQVILCTSSAPCTCLVRCIHVCTCSCQHRAAHT